MRFDLTRKAVEISLCIIVLAGLTPVIPAPAKCAESYDSLEVGASYSANTNRNEFHEFWESGSGFDLQLATAYHQGRLWFGTRILYNTSKSSGAPDFQSAYVYTGWSFPLPAPRRVKLEPGFTFGVTAFFFEDEENEGLKNETEATGELFLRASLPLYAGWSLTATGSSQIIFTHKRTRLIFVSAGISRRLSMPGWMRSVLE